MGYRWAHGTRHAATMGEAEVIRFLTHRVVQVAGGPWLVALLLNGAGLRLMEAITLQVKEVELSPPHSLASTSVLG